MAGKSLGTLTIDLIAKVGGFVQGMDKAERASQKWSAQVKRRQRSWCFYCCNWCSSCHCSCRDWCRRFSSCEKYSTAGNRG